MENIFSVAALQKQNRGKQTEFPLRGQTWGLIFFEAVDQDSSLI